MNLDALIKISVFLFDYIVTSLMFMAFAKYYNSWCICAAIPFSIAAGIMGVKIYEGFTKGGMV